MAVQQIFPPRTNEFSPHQATHQSGGTDALAGNLDANARVQVKKNGVAMGTRRAINLAEGSGISLAVSDDAANEEVDITPAVNFAGTGAANTAARSDHNHDATYAPLSHQTRHQAGGADALTGNLDANARVQVKKNDVAVGTRRAINLVDGSGISITATDDTINEEVDITPSVNFAGTGAANTVARSDHNHDPTYAPLAHQARHQAGGADALTGNLDANARVRVKKNAVAVGTRRAINLIEGSGISITATDDTINEEVDITPSVNFAGTGAANTVARSDHNHDPTYAPLAHQARHQAGGADALTGNLDANARVRVKKNAVAVGTRRAINLIEGSGISITATDDTINEEVDITPSVNFAGTGAANTVARSDHNHDPTYAPLAHQARHQAGGADALTGNLDANARVRVKKNAVAVGTRRAINLIEGSGISITATDDTINEEVDITPSVNFAGTGAANTAARSDHNHDATYAPLSHQTRHQAGGADALTGNLDANARVQVKKNGVAVGTRRAINLAEGSGISLAVSDDATNEEVDITPAVNFAGTGAANTAARSDHNHDATYAPLSHQTRHQAGGADALTGNLDANARVQVKKNGVAVGTRRAINLIEGSGISLTVSDDTANEEVDVTLSATGGGGGGSNITRIAGATGTAGPDLTFQRLTSNQSTSSTTPTAAITTTLAAGIYHARYYLFWASTHTAYGIKHQVSFTGTTVRAAGTFNTGSTSHDQNATSPIASYALNFRAFGANLQEQGVDTANELQLTIGEVYFEVSTGGDLIYSFASESASGTITLYAGSSLVLTKID